MRVRSRERATEWRDTCDARRATSAVSPVSAKGLLPVLEGPRNKLSVTADTTSRCRRRQTARMLRLECYESYGFPESTASAKLRGRFSGVFNSLFLSLSLFFCFSLARCNRRARPSALRKLPRQKSREEQWLPIVTARNNGDLKEREGKKKRE